MLCVNSAAQLLNKPSTRIEAPKITWWTCALANLQPKRWTVLNNNLSWTLKWLSHSCSFPTAESIHPIRGTDIFLSPLMYSGVRVLLGLYLWWRSPGLTCWQRRSLTCRTRSQWPLSSFSFQFARHLSQLMQVVCCIQKQHSESVAVMNMAC